MMHSVQTILDIEPPPGCVVRFISDLHFGNSRSRAPEIAQFGSLLQGIGMLVLCGDTQEGGSTDTTARQSAILCDQLRDLCAQHGVVPVQLAGNHDPDAGPQLLRLWGGRVAAMHGHALLPHVSPWSRELPRCIAAVRELRRTLPRGGGTLLQQLELTRNIAALLARHRCCRDIPQPMRCFFLRELRHCFWPPLRPLQIVSAWLTCGARAELWCRRYMPDTDLLIIGHFHRSGSWRKGGRIILNTGAWFKHAVPYAADVQDARLLRFFPVRIAR